MYNYASSQQDDNNEWNKQFKKVSFAGPDKPWTAPPNAANLNVSDMKAWERREKYISSIAESYVNSRLPNGMRNSNDIKTDLYAYWGVDRPDVVNSVISKLIIHPKTIASRSSNQADSYDITYNRDAENSNK
jgi:hypothetical protein